MRTTWELASRISPDFPASDFGLFCVWAARSAIDPSINLPAAKRHERREVPVRGIVPRCPCVAAIMGWKSAIPARRQAPLNAVLIWPPL